jgi:predicted metal-dependent HD superfamily phosphohydrolase
MTSRLTRNAFRDLVNKDISANIVDREYEAILKAYGEEQRHYHTTSHIHTMWAAWDHYTRAVQHVGDYSDKMVKLAILFHEYGLGFCTGIISYLHGPIQHCI